MTTETLAREQDAATPETCSYDRVPYESLPFKHAHPDRLAVLAQLLGLRPASVDKCRVLEIGCASGGNITPVAYTLSESEFLGIDLSSRQVNDGKEIVKKLGLKNIEIRHQSILDFPEDAGEFDYIITHGVYSWIPYEAQEKILEICQRHLSPHGVAYISYNTYPGWNFRGAIRQMMLYSTRSLTDPNEKLAKAREIVNFLGRAVKQFTNAAVGPYAIKPYELLLEEEAGFLQNQRPDYLLHEHLSDVNEPLYFWQFVERAERFGLQYLSESEYSTTRTTNFAKEVQDELNKYSDILQVEQYMDFLRNRTFRQTLLCRKEVNVDRSVPKSRFADVYVASPAVPSVKVENVQSNEPVAFTHGGSTLTTTNPIVKAAFLHLQEIWPRSISFSELLVAARSRVSSVSIQDAEAFERGSQVLANDLLLSYGINIVFLRTQPDPFVTQISERPEASAVARLQAKTTSRVTNVQHELIDLSFLEKHLIDLLDGTRDRDAIFNGLVDLVKQDILVVNKDGKPIKDEADVREQLVPHVDVALSRLANASLLVG
jgi:Predicted regulatory domain of a methyltransferase